MHLLLSLVCSTYWEEPSNLLSSLACATIPVPPSFPIPNVQSCKSQQAGILISLMLIEVAKLQPVFFVSTQMLGGGNDILKHGYWTDPFPSLQFVLQGRRSSACIYWSKMEDSAAPGGSSAACCVSVLWLDNLKWTYKQNTKKPCMLKWRWLQFAPTCIFPWNCCCGLWLPICFLQGGCFTFPSSLCYLLCSGCHEKEESYFCLLQIRWVMKTSVIHVCYFSGSSLILVFAVAAG